MFRLNPIRLLLRGGGGEIPSLRCCVTFPRLDLIRTIANLDRVTLAAILSRAYLDRRILRRCLKASRCERARHSQYLALLYDGRLPVSCFVWSTMWVYVSISPPLRCSPTLLLLLLLLSPRREVCAFQWTATIFLPQLVRHRSTSINLRLMLRFFVS